MSELLKWTVIVLFAFVGLETGLELYFSYRKLELKREANTRIDEWRKGVKDE